MVGAAFIHIGVSKTATTTLQQNVFERLNGILYLGKPAPHERDRAVNGFSDASSELLQRTLRDTIRGSLCSSQHIEVLRGTIQALKMSGEPVIYSNELLTNNKHLSFSEIASRVRDIFGPSTLILTVRNPQTALLSQHLHELARLPGVPFSFTKWLDDAIENPRRINQEGESLEQYRYISMLNQLRTVFDGNIKILRYEDLVTSPSAFSLALARLIGVEHESIETLLKLPPLKTTRSKTYSYLVKKIRAVTPSALISLFHLNKLNVAIERSIAKKLKPFNELSDYDQARISQFFPYQIPSDILVNTSDASTPNHSSH
jgi:hypothetical protein